MLSVLYRTLVLPFYVRNAGTFLVVVLLAFGFMRPMDHEALITAALGSPFLLSLIIGLWMLYTLRTVSFVRKQMTIPEHLFLRTFQLIPTQRRWFLWLTLLTNLLVPVLGYAIWMIMRAIHYQTLGSLAGIILSVVALILGGAWASDYRLHHHRPEAIRLPALNVRLPYELFFPTYWLRHEPLSLFLTKLISWGLLVGVCRLYPTDNYDERLLLIGLMLSLITHSQVSRQLDEFEQRYLIFLPNLPLSGWQRLGRYALTYGLLWLPELFILIRNNSTAVRLDYVGWLWLTGWGWLMLMHSLAYGRNVSPERWQTGVFWSFIIGLLAIMFSVPVGVWLALGWLGATGIWHWSIYRRFEK